MHKLIMIIFLLLCLGSFSQPSTITRHALIFAIGDYPESGGWPKISSLGDVPYIENVLLNQGFLKSNIKVVADKDASIAGIKNAFEELIGTLKEKDIVVIHFSSHGERVEADNFNKIDGLDECIVTINALAPDKSKNYQKDQAEYLRGHVLGDYLKRIRIKLGNSGDLVVFMDDCYSGSGTRGVAKVRGGEIPLVASPPFDLRKHFKSDSSLLYKELIISAEDEKKMSPYSVFAASMPDQQDQEAIDEISHQDVGSLTYAISRAFESLRSGSAKPTYSALFATIQSNMINEGVTNTPLLEGNENDRVVLGGQFQHQMPFLRISSIDASNHITIEGGAMEGLSEGAEIAICGAGTPDTANATILAKGKIIRSDDFSSTAIINKNLPTDTVTKYWVFVTEHTYRIKPVTIQFAKNKSKNPAESFSLIEMSNIKKFLGRLSFVNFSQNAEMEIVKWENADSLKIIANGNSFLGIKNIIDDSAIVKDKLESYARYKFLQDLRSEVNGVSVEVRLVPLINGRPDTNKIKERTVNGTFVTYESDTLTLRIRNTGVRDAYVNILDMQPDGVINPVLPSKSLRHPIYPYDLKISVGEEYFLPTGDFVIIGPPDGKEVYKIFASEKQIDVENIATTKGAARGGGAMTMMEKLVNNSFALSRGGPTSSDANADATITDLIFLIKSRQKE